MRQLDHAMARIGGRRSMLIEARTPMNLAVLRPVFEPLLLGPALRVQFTGPHAPISRAAFKALGVSRSASSAARRRGGGGSISISTPTPGRRCRSRRVDKQLNFFHGVAGKFDLDCPVGLPLGFERYDRVAFPNEGRRNAYVAAGIVPEDRAVLVGYPKADVLTCRRAISRAHGGVARPRRDCGRRRSSRRRSRPHRR